MTPVDFIRAFQNCLWIYCSSIREKVRGGGGSSAERPPSSRSSQNKVNNLTIGGENRILLNWAI